MSLAPAEAIIDGHKISVMPMLTMEGLALKVKLAKLLATGTTDLTKIDEAQILEVAKLLIVKVSVDDQLMTNAYDLYFADKQVLFFKVLKFALESHFGEISKLMAASESDFLAAAKKKMLAMLSPSTSAIIGQPTASPSLA
jgi:hypothetical protein